MMALWCKISCTFHFVLQLTFRECLKYTENIMKLIKLQNLYNDYTALQKITTKKYFVHQKSSPPPPQKKIIFKISHPPPLTLC